MNYLTIASAVYATLACFAEGQPPCKTPNGVPGTCTSLLDCKPLLDIVNKRSATEVKFLKNSQCGHQGKIPTVCCPLEDGGATPKDCFTPDGNSGICIDVLQCEHVVELLKPPVSQEIETFIQNSRCAGQTQHSVCCGPAPSSKRSARSTGTCATTLSAIPPDPATGCCGHGGNKIFGGLATAIHDYPWLAIIEYQKDGVKKDLCNGVLISGRYVLTAGHCVAGTVLNIATPSSVRLGEYDVSRNGPDCISIEGGEDCTEGELKIPIESITPHPEYIPGAAGHKNDIALIRLKDLTPFTDFIRPICLPQIDATLDPPSSLTMRMAGWGSNKTRNSSAVKIHASLPFVNAQECEAAYAERKVQLWNKQLCAGGTKESCIATAGSPLMYQNGVMEAVGVFSFGPTQCGVANIPDVYTKVVEYKDWIMSNIKP